MSFVLAFDCAVTGLAVAVTRDSETLASHRAEGLPRPLYLRGVNITLPDGARRTVE